MVIETDFGKVKLSAKTMTFLRSLDPEWMELVTGKSRSRHARYVRNTVKQIQDAACIGARIEWNAGGVLKTY